MNIKAIVTDIEGTTSSIDFVHKVLFPYAHSHLPEYVREHKAQKEIELILQEVREIVNEPELDFEGLISIFLQWIKEDRKTTALKTLQGKIWSDGYKNGAFTGHVYEDAERNLKNWHAKDLALYIYSSGSVAAQKLLFGYSDVGDLTGLFTGYFDTRIGNKRESVAYQNIVEQLELPAQNILFLSDIVEELDAASQVGLNTIQLVREETQKTGNHPIAHNFDEISF